MLIRNNLHLKALLLCLASLLFSAPSGAAFVGDIDINLSQTLTFPFDLTNNSVDISTPGDILEFDDGSTIASGVGGLSVILQGTSIEVGTQSITFNIFGGGAPSQPGFLATNYTDAAFVLSGFDEPLRDIFGALPTEFLGITGHSFITGLSGALLIDYALDTITLNLGGLGISTDPGAENIGSITVGVVPVPAALPLMLSALGILAWLARRRQA